jgi:hypothetical protein
MWVSYQQSSILDGEDQGDQRWIESQGIPKIAGLHDKLGRVIRLTRLDHPLRGGQTALPKKAQLSPKKVYKPNIDPERTTSLDIIQIGTMDIPIEKSGTGPVVLNNQVATPTQKDQLLQMIMRPAEASLARNTSCQGGFLPV